MDGSTALFVIVVRGGVRLPRVGTSKLLKTIFLADDFKERGEGMMYNNNNLI